MVSNIGYMDKKVMLAIGAAALTVGAFDYATGTRSAAKDVIEQSSSLNELAQYAGKPGVSDQTSSAIKIYGEALGARIKPEPKLEPAHPGQKTSAVINFAGYRPPAPAPK